MTAINKYNTSMIYTIRSPTTDKYYIGSTTQKLCKRFSDHKINYKLYLKGAFNFITSFELLELGDAYIELLEEINCNNKTQLVKREGELIREHKKDCVNKRIDGRTPKEYNIDNKEHIKQYRIDNKEHIKEYGKRYNIDNKEHIKEYGKQYNIDNKEHIKQYQIDNKEHIKEIVKQYRINNKEHRKEYDKQRYNNKKKLQEEINNIIA